MSFPAQHRRQSETAVAVDSSSVGMYARLLTPVVLVTSMKGREVFRDSRRLFERLEFIGETLRCGHLPGERAIMAIWQGDEHVSDSGVQALEFMLETTGLEAFNRACKRQRGAGRAIGSKYQWYFVSEYLGWTWERA